MRNFLTNKNKLQKSITIMMSFLLMMWASMAYSQTGTVTGTVTDATTGETLIGVNVAVKGTTNGGITDANGKFSISSVPANAVLVISYVGYTTQEIPVGSQRNINVRLSEDTQGLEEVIVIGYGTRKAGEMTGAVSTVKMEEIQKLPAVSAGEALRNVPGITVTMSNTPGADPRVRVRGVGTINNSNPLWVIDGVPGAPVNPNDIETMTVLKDAAAAAIYGTRAANGVILVTTKQGRKGERAKLNIEFRTGYQSMVNHYKLLNTEEYGRLLWLEQKNGWNKKDPATGQLLPVQYQHAIYGSGETPSVPDYINPARGVLGQVDESLYKWALPADGGNLITRANKEGTDWFGVVGQNGRFIDTSASLTGGSDKAIYGFNFGYINQEGIMKYTGFDRLNLRMNIRADVNKYITVGASLTGQVQNTKGMANANANNEDSAIAWTYRIQPIIPVYDVGGNFAGSRANPGAFGNARNPLGVLYYSKDRNLMRVLTSGNVFANINIIEGLQFRTLASWIFNQQNQKNISFYDISHSEGGTSDNVQMTHDYTKRWSWSNTLEYKKRFGLHELTLMGGTEAQRSDYYQTWANRVGYPLRIQTFMDLQTGTGAQTNGSSRSAWSMFSMFGRFYYAYDSKYLLEAVVRRDGSSRFAAGQRYGVFPGFSLGWVISKEPFMASTQTWLDNLKIRGGWGISGNDQMGDYNSYTTYTYQYDASQGTYYPLSGSNSAVALGYRQNNLGNTDVKWETTKQTNVALDVALKMGVYFSLDVWTRRTTDMLFPKAIPATLGRVGAPSLNVGEMLNNGYDLDLGYRGSAMNRTLNYSVSLNVSHYKNEVVKLSGNPKEYLEGDDMRQSRYTRTEAGHAFPEFYGYVVDGIFQTQAEVDAHAVYGDYNAVGRYKFRDLNGDGKINADDRTYIGSPHPDFYGGMNFSVDYKGFDINGQFRYSYGNKMVNYARRWLDYDMFKGGRSWASLYKTFGSPYLVGEATLPRAESARTESQQSSTAFVEDASFLRLSNLQLGYNFGKLLKAPEVPTLRLYVQVTNLFTFTKYSGLDPETSEDSGSRTAFINYGTDRGQWPTARNVMVGISLGF